MPTLNDILREIDSCIDFETGEILDYERLEQLQIDKKEKLKHIALLIRDTAGDIEKIAAIERGYRDRRRAKENLVSRLKELLAQGLEGQKLDTPEVYVSYRNSEAVEIDDDAEIPAEFLKQREPDIDRMALKAVLKDGAEIPGIRLVRKSNIQIK
jgi:hypothetical protein